DDGAATFADAFNKSWAKFAGPANVQTWDGRLLYYYRDGIGFNGCALDEGPLLTKPSGSGQCGSFAFLLMGVLGLNGIESQFVSITPTGDGPQMLIKEWQFPRQSFPGAAAYKWKMEFNPIAIAAGDIMVPKQPGDIYGDAVNQPALPGQNTVPPSEK